MKKANNCEFCNNYIYDEYYNYYYCDINLDEDEMARFLSGINFSCPYFESNNEYEIVRKQN